MGADFWEYYTPDQENPREALKEVQETVFKSGAFFSNGTREDEIKSNEDAIRSLDNDDMLDEELKEDLKEAYSSQIKSRG